MEKIREYFSRYVSLSDRDWEFFRRKLQSVSFSKHAIVLEKGATEKYLSFITSGIVRLYIPDEAHEVTFGFAFQDEFVSAYDSFITQAPCSYQLQAITEVSLYRITHADLQEVYRNSAVGQEIGRRQAEQLFLQKSQREISLLTKTAEQRYLDLFTARPEVLHHIPLKYIASYIGITPQALSRIRKNLLT